jgi:hypothetical protein
LTLTEKDFQEAFQKWRRRWDRSLSCTLYEFCMDRLNVSSTLVWNLGFSMTNSTKCICAPGKIFVRTKD